MPGVHVFVDESKRGAYVVVAAAVATTDLDATRRSLRGLLLPGQSALHFKDEQDGRRRSLLGSFTGLQVEGRVYVRHGGNQVAARQACLEALVEDLPSGAERLVLELADGDLAADKRVLYAAQRKHAGTWTYHHMRATQEPVLWAADGLAWAWSRGGSWRSSVTGLITKTVKV
jgi:hypothetical protein